jgi:hypothetical protein
MNVSPRRYGRQGQLSGNCRRPEAVSLFPFLKCDRNIGFGDKRARLHSTWQNRTCHIPERVATVSDMILIAPVNARRKNNTVPNRRFSVQFNALSNSVDPVLSPPRCFFRAASGATFLTFYLSIFLSAQSEPRIPLESPLDLCVIPGTKMCFTNRSAILSRSEVLRKAPPVSTSLMSGMSRPSRHKLSSAAHSCSADCGPPDPRRRRHWRRVAGLRAVIEGVNELVNACRFL